MIEVKQNLVKAEDGIIVDLEDAFDKGIIKTDEEHYTLAYRFSDGDGIEYIKTIATYRTAGFARRAMKRLDKTGQISLGGKTNFISEADISRKRMLDMFSQYNKSLVEADGEVDWEWVEDDDDDED